MKEASTNQVTACLAQLGPKHAVVAALWLPTSHFTVFLQEQQAGTSLTQTYKNIVPGRIGLMHALHPPPPQALSFDKA